MSDKVLLFIYKMARIGIISVIVFTLGVAFGKKFPDLIIGIYLGLIMFIFAITQAVIAHIFSRKQKNQQQNKHTNSTDS